MGNTGVGATLSSRAGSAQFSTRLHGVTTLKIVFVIIIISRKPRTHDPFVGVQPDLFEIGKAVKTNSPS